jgi:hypothetical protein
MPNLNLAFGSSTCRTLNLNVAFSSVRFRFKPFFEPELDTTNISIDTPVKEVALEFIRLCTTHRKW